jgi:hypothetical protein
MTKPNAGRRSRKPGRAGFPTLKIAIVVGLIAAVSLGVFLASGAKSSNAAQKRYKATREIVVDKQTGQRRMPTQEEIDQTVANLSELANRPENVPETQGAGDAIVADLAGGYGGVMLVRPAENGNWETRCVFTFEEGADFLGLVEDNSAE